MSANPFNLIFIDKVNDMEDNLDFSTEETAGCPNCKSTEAIQGDRYASYTLVCVDCGQEYYLIDNQARLL